MEIRLSSEPSRHNQIASRRPKHRRFFCLAALLIAAGMALSAHQLPAQQRTFDVEYRAQIGKLAGRLQQAGHEEAAEQVRKHSFSRDPHRQYAFFPSPARRLKPDRNGDAAALRRLEKEWYELRRSQAERLLSLAGQVVAADPGQAYRLLHEALYEDPSSARVRRILGLPTRSGRPSSAKAVRPKQPHPWFGWSPRQYWIVRSPHFEIVSHLRGSAPRQLAQRLERLLAVWRQVFFEYWSDGEWLRDRFAGGTATPIESQRFHVVLFRDREDYLRNLSGVEPQIAQSLGYYVPKRKTSFFYSGRERPWATWHHEVTHQLFQETEGGIADPGERAQIWVVEGVALYMESLRLFDGYATVGGYDAGRLQFARYRRLQSGYYIPLEELSGLGRAELQQRDDVRRVYSQCAGLVHYLMDGQGGRLRPGFLRFVHGVYQGRESTDRLLGAIGVTHERFDRGYTSFLMVGDDELKYTGLSEQVRQLSLGKTRVTSAGISHLRHLRDLEWLDVAGLPLGNRDLDWLGQNRKLTQLMLEGTQVDDAFADKLGKLTRLVELDLSGTRIGDPMLPAVGRLSGLESLWLNDTHVTDAGIVSLARLRKLEYLDVSNTKVTPAGVEKLKRALPKLKEVKFR